MMKTYKLQIKHILNIMWHTVTDILELYMAFISKMSLFFPCCLCFLFLNHFVCIFWFLMWSVFETGSALRDVPVLSKTLIQNPKSFRHCDVNKNSKHHKHRRSVVTVTQSQLLQTGCINVSIKRSMMYTLTLRLKCLCLQQVWVRFHESAKRDCLLNSGANENIKAGNVWYSFYAYSKLTC